MAINADVIPKLMGKVRPEACELLDLHRRAGRSTYIVSASPQEMVGPLAEALGMTGGIGTVSEVKEGVYTGELAGPFCYAAGKVKRSVSWPAGKASTSNAASRTATRRATCRCSKPWVTGRRQPRRSSPASARPGWPIVIFSRRTKRVVKRSAAVAGGQCVRGGLLRRRYLGRRSPAPASERDFDVRCPDRGAGALGSLRRVAASTPRRRSTT